MRSIGLQFNNFGILRCYFGCWPILVLVSLGVAGCKARYHQQLPLAAHALQEVDLKMARPVNEAELAWNTERRLAGLNELQPGWRVAPANLKITHSPQIGIILNPHGMAVKVTLHTYSEQGQEVLEEYEVHDKALNGLAARWYGKPPRLCETVTYRDNNREGLSRYFDAARREVSKCEFRYNQPWTGRTLERRGFDSPRWDVSYCQGKLDGAEVQFGEYGFRTNRLRTFRAGIQHGPDRQYDGAGRLRSEAEYASGIIVFHRSWYTNGQLEWLDPMDAQGRPDGCRKKWDSSGQLLVEENYRHGGKHGRQWEKGHQEVWFWENRFLGGGAFGATEFHSRER